MTAALKIEGPKIGTHDPKVGAMANRLIDLFVRNGNQDDGDNWGVVEEILNFATEASQRIAAQRQRIAYLESLSTTDELTGLANRRGLLQHLYRTISRVRRHREKALVGFFDLDDLKRVNDTYGHEAGDAVLLHLAGLLKKNIRSSDFAARVGGDEFVVILERAGLRSGGARLGVIRDLIESHPARYRGVSIPVRVSLGSAELDGDTGVNEILAAADDSMYADKDARKRARRRFQRAG